MEHDNQRLLAFNPKSGNGADYHSIKELACRYGYSLFNLAEVFEAIPTPVCDQRLRQLLEKYELIAVLSGDGTLFSVLRNSRPDARVLHLPNGGLNVVASKLSNWKNYSHERILQAVADHNYRLIELQQGHIESDPGFVPEIFYWTVGTGLSSDILNNVNRLRKQKKHIRNILATAVSFFTALKQGQFHTALVNGRRITAQGFDVIKKDIPYYGPLELHTIEGLDITSSDILVTYGADIDPNTPMHPIQYIVDFLRDTMAINIAHRMPTQGMIRLMLIPHGSSVTFQLDNNYAQYYPQVDSEVYMAQHPITAIPSVKNSQTSRLIGK